MWENASAKDINELTEMFWDNIVRNPHYISHGEMQMGVAAEPGRPEADGKEKWRKYITAKLDNVQAQLPSCILVYKEDGNILAFCVLELAEDGDRPFGVICDMLVREDVRGKGLGRQMFEKAVEWFQGLSVRDIYLESGAENHRAHAFFEQHGFRMVSHVFRLRI